MLSAILIFGEPIAKTFFLELLKQKDDKYLTDFKRYFNYLKKHHPNYISKKQPDIISIDQPLIDYVNIIKDWLELDTNNMYTLYYIQKDKNKIDIDEDIIYFSYKLKNKISIEEIYEFSKNWLKKKSLKNYIIIEFSFLMITQKAPYYYQYYNNIFK